MLLKFPNFSRILGFSKIYISELELLIFEDELALSFEIM